MLTIKPHRLISTLIKSYIHTEHQGNHNEERTNR